MTDNEKLLKLRKLADAMYYAAQYLTTDTLRLHKAMEEYHQFIIHEYFKEEPVSEDLEEAIEDAMPDANWYIEENNDTTGEDAYNSIQMGNMFKAGAEWQKKQFE